MQGLGGNLEGIIKIEGPNKAKLKVTMVLVTTLHVKFCGFFILKNYGTQCVLTM
jgi:hypothetical protein